MWKCPKCNREADWEIVLGLLLKKENKNFNPLPNVARGFWVVDLKYS